MNNTSSSEAVEIYDEAVALMENGELKKSLVIYNRIIKNFGKITDTETQKTVAMSLVNKAGVFAQLERYDDAIKVCDDVVARFGQSSQPVLRRQAAMALNNKAVYLGNRKGQHEDANTVYDEFLLKFGKDEEEIAELIAEALVGKSAVLAYLGRFDESIKASTEVLQRFSASHYPAVQAEVEQAVNNRAMAMLESEPTGQAEEAHELNMNALDLDSEHKYEQALDIYRQVIKKHSGQTHSALRIETACAMILTQMTLQKAGDHKKAIQASQTFIKRFANDDEPSIRKRMADSLSLRAKLYYEAEDVESFIKSLDEIDQMFSADTFPASLVSVVVTAQNYKIGILCEMQKYERAIVACNQILRHYPQNSVKPVPNSHIMSIMLGKAICLGDIRECQQAIDVHDEIERRFDDQKDRDSRLLMVKSLRHKVVCLHELGHNEEATPLHGLVLLKFGNDIDPEIRHYAQIPDDLSDFDDDD